MLIKIDDVVINGMRQFLAECNIEPTEQQLRRFCKLCLTNGLDNVILAHKCVQCIVELKPEVAVKIPKDGICPNCKHKLVIGQNSKITCNCRIW